MSFFAALGAAFWAWQGTLGAARRLRPWTPLLVLALLRVLALLITVLFYRPGVVGFAEPWVRWVGGEAATHYPEHLYTLPDLVRATDTLLLPLCGALAWGVAVHRFAQHFGALAQDRFALWDRFPALFGIVSLLVGVEWAVLGAFSLVPDEIRAISSAVRLALLAAQWGLITAAYFVFTYALQGAVIEHRALASSLRRSLRLRRDIPLTTAFLILLPMGVRFPFFVAGQIDLDERGMPPEGMVVLMGVQIFVELILTHAWLGSATRIFAWRRAEGGRR